MPSKRAVPRGPSVNTRVQRLRWVLLNARDELRVEERLISQLPPGIRFLLWPMTKIRQGALTLALNWVSLPIYFTRPAAENFRLYARRSGGVFSESYVQFLRNTRNTLAVCFVSALAVLLAIPAALYTRQHVLIERPRVIHVGLLSRVSTLGPLFQAFQQGMAQAGWQEHKNIVYEAVYVPAQADIDTVVQSAAERNPDLLVAAGPALAGAAARVTNVPTVFLDSFDPVNDQLIASYASSNNNLVGVGNAALIDRQLEMYQRLFPAAGRLGLIVVPTDPTSISFRDAIEHELTRYDSVAVTQNVSSIDQIPAVFHQLKAEGSAVVYVTPSALLTKNISFVAQSAIAEQLATITNSQVNAQGGLLLSLYSDLDSIGQDLAILGDEILRGASPASLSSRYPRKSILAINQATARLIGLTIPESLLNQADILY